MDGAHPRLQGLDGAAQQVVASSVADPTTINAARVFAQTVLSEAALYSFGNTIGNLLSGRRLQQQQQQVGWSAANPKCAALILCTSPFHDGIHCILRPER
jgi:hypothetical protein